MHTGTRYILSRVPFSVNAIRFVGKVMHNLENPRPVIPCAAPSLGRISSK